MHRQKWFPACMVRFLMLTWILGRDIVLGILARIAPQMNMFVIGMQLKIFVGLVVLYFVMNLLPVAVSMLRFLGQQQITNNPVATPILLAIVWGAGFGGFGSPLGSSSNLVAISYLD